MTPECVQEIVDETAAKSGYGGLENHRLELALARRDALLREVVIVLSVVSNMSSREYQLKERIERELEKK
jgi:hypothetical protein